MGMAAAMNPKAHDRPRWTAAQMDAYERARDLLTAVIAAYSACAETTDAPQETSRIEHEITTLAIEQQTLTADSTERVQEIIETFPALLATIRESQQ